MEPRQEDMDGLVGEASSAQPCRALTKVRARAPSSLRATPTTKTRASHVTTGAHPQIPCRYGLGCTHMADPVHLQRFWHPSLPEQRTANPEDGFVCNECGLVFADVHELQVPSRVPSARRRRVQTSSRSPLVDVHARFAAAHASEDGVVEPVADRVPRELFAG